MPTVGMPRHARSLGPALSQSVRRSPATRAPRVPVDHRPVSRAQRLPGAAHRGEMGDDTEAAPRPRSGRPALQAAASQATCPLRSACFSSTLKEERKLEKRTRTNKTGLSLGLPDLLSSPHHSPGRGAQHLHTWTCSGSCCPRATRPPPGMLTCVSCGSQASAAACQSHAPCVLGRASPFSLSGLWSATWDAQTPREDLSVHGAAAAHETSQASAATFNAGREDRAESRASSEQASRRAGAAEGGGGRGASKSAGGAYSHSLASSRSNGTTRSALTDEMNEDELRATIEQSLALLEKTVEQASMEKEALLVSLYVGTGCHCGVCTPALISVRGT